jgi:hypothetical protein
MKFFKEATYIIKKSKETTVVLPIEKYEELIEGFSLAFINSRKKRKNEPTIKQMSALPPVAFSKSRYYRRRQ